MDSHARLHAELTGFLRQHCPVCDERHLALLGWMVAGLLLSQTVCFGHWQRDPSRIDRLLLVIAIAVLVSSLQGFAVSLSGLRRQVDPHWRRLSFGRLDLKWLQQCVTDASRRIQAWMPIPLQQLEPCIPSRDVQQRQKQAWFTRLELPPRLTAQRTDRRRMTVSAEMCRAVRARQEIVE